MGLPGNKIPVFESEEPSANDPQFPVFRGIAVSQCDIIISISGVPDGKGVVHGFTGNDTKIVHVHFNCGRKDLVDMGLHNPVEALITLRDSSNSSYNSILLSNYCWSYYDY